VCIFLQCGAFLLLKAVQALLSVFRSYLVGQGKMHRTDLHDKQLVDNSHRITAGDATSDSSSAEARERIWVVDSDAELETALEYKVLSGGRLAVVEILDLLARIIERHRS